MRVERLSDRHDLTGFRCGVEARDAWLRQHAHENQRRNLSRTFVLLDDDQGVSGYYSLTMGGVRRASLPKKYGRGLPDFDIGMVLLARFAISATHHGQGLGRDLLIEAIERGARAGLQVAARFIAVDPLDARARTFYEHFGFSSINGDGEGRMFLRIDEALAALGAISDEATSDPQ